MANELQAYSDQMAAAVEKAGRSIVSVDARNHVPGSGIVWSADGEILTADHIVQRDENINVTLPDGTTHTATIIGRDPGSDLVLLKVDASGLTPAEWNESAKVGNLAFAVGRPGDLQASLGIVSAVGGPVRGRRRQIEAYIQTDVIMYPGFSGGPLVDASGRLLGLNSSALGRDASIALPYSAVKPVVEALKVHGHVKRGFLGVHTQPVRLAAALSESLKQETGLMVIGTEADGPAAAGGLMQGDVLVGLGDTTISEIDDLQSALGPGTVGKILKAKIVRGGEVKELSLTVGERA
jgi:S1-C subfamily serine protease